MVGVRTCTEFLHAERMHVVPWPVTVTVRLHAKEKCRMLVQTFNSDVQDCKNAQLACGCESKEVGNSFAGHDASVIHCIIIGTVINS